MRYRFLFEQMARRLAMAAEVMRLAIEDGQQRDELAHGGRRRLEDHELVRVEEGIVSFVQGALER